MMDISTVRTIAAMVPGERTRTLLLLLCAEVERLQHEVADLQMLRDEHQMDVMHAFQEGGEGERRKVVAWLLRPTDPADEVLTLRWAREIEKGEHRREEEP